MGFENPKMNNNHNEKPMTETERKFKEAQELEKRLAEERKGKAGGKKFYPESA